MTDYTSHHGTYLAHRLTLACASRVRLDHPLSVAGGPPHDIQFLDALVDGYAGGLIAANKGFIDQVSAGHARTAAGDSRRDPTAGSDDADPTTLLGARVCPLAQWDVSHSIWTACSPCECHDKVAHQVTCIYKSRVGCQKAPRRHREPPGPPASAAQLDLGRPHAPGVCDRRVCLSALWRATAGDRDGRGSTRGAPDPHGSPRG